MRCYQITCKTRAISRVIPKLALFGTLVLIHVAKPLAEESTDPTDSELQALTADLIAWVGEHSEYDVTAFLDDPPQISFCDSGETIDYEGQSVVVHEYVKGVYDLEVNSITLVRPWDRQDLLNISTLLHELVHVVQYHSKQWPCWHATEWEAYKLQEQWLMERDIDPKFNWVEIHLLSSCSQRDIHE